MQYVFDLYDYCVQRQNAYKDKTLALCHVEWDGL